MDPRAWIGSGLYSIPIDLIRYDTGGSCESTDTIRYDTFEMWWWCIGAYLDLCNPCLLRPKVSSDGPLRPKLATFSPNFCRVGTCMFAYRCIP